MVNLSVYLFILSLLNRCLIHPGLIERFLFDGYSKDLPRIDEGSGELTGFSQVHESIYGWPEATVLGGRGKAEIGGAVSGFACHGTPGKRARV